MNTATIRRALAALTLTVLAVADDGTASAFAIDT
jgi:hypothetical protein